MCHAQPDRPRILRGKAPARPAIHLQKHVYLRVITCSLTPQGPPTLALYAGRQVAEGTPATYGDAMVMIAFVIPP